MSWSPERDRASRLCEEADEAEEAGNWGQAEDLFREAAAADPEDFYPRLRLGGLLVENAHTRSEALRQLERARELAPGEPLTLVALGCGLIEVGRHDEARACLLRSLDEDPSPEAFVLLAGIQDKAGEAKRLYRQALELDPEYAEAHVKLASQLLVEDVEAGMRHLRRAIEIDPTSAHAQLSLGLILLHEGKVEEARGYLDRAAEFEAECHGAWEEVGKLYFDLASTVEGERGEYLDRAIRALRRAIDPDNERVSVHAYLGVAYKERDRPDPALREFRRAVELGDGSEFGLALGEYLAHLGRFKEADAVFAQAALDYPNCVMVWRSFGVLLTRGDRPQLVVNFSRAVVAFERALELDPDDCESLFWLCFSLCCLGSKHVLRAKVHLQRCLKLCPEYAGARALMEKVEKLLVSPSPWDQESDG